MNKLEKLYESIRTLEELSIPLNPETLKAVDELEEKIIKDEILPTLSEQVAPLLKPIQRDLVLVLEYHPGEEISVALSRKVKVAEMLGAKTMSAEATPSGADDWTPITRSPKTGLCVFLKDGTFMQERKACDTFVKAILVAGIAKVRALNLVVCKVPLISDKLDDNYKKSQHAIDGGLYICAHASNAQKKKILEKISKLLGLDWKVEVVD